MVWEWDIDFIKGKIFVIDFNLIEKLFLYIKKEDFSKFFVVFNYYSFVNFNNNNFLIFNYVLNGVKYRGLGERIVKKLVGILKVVIIK